MKYIMGLGNPGLKYRKTRHNIGFMFVNFLANKQKWQISQKGKLKYLRTKINDAEVELIKPQTFMNTSGFSASYLVKKHQNMNVTNDLIIIHDDVDVPFGETKMTLSASSGGHNGIKSIIEKLGTQNFIRLRIGIGKSEDVPTDKYVLQKFSREESKILPEIFAKTKKTIELIVNNDITSAQQFFNTKK